MTVEFQPMNLYIKPAGLPAKIKAARRICPLQESSYRPTMTRMQLVFMAVQSLASDGAGNHPEIEFPHFTEF
jgi:hypothetical protein